MQMSDCHSINSDELDDRLSMRDNLRTGYCGVQIDCESLAIDWPQLP